MQRNNRRLLTLVLAAAAVITALLGVAIVLITRPTLEAIALNSILIGSADAEAGLYGSNFSSGSVDFLQDYPGAADLPKAASSASISLRGSGEQRGTAWIWLYRDDSVGDQLYDLFREDMLREAADTSGWSTTTNGDLEQIGERASFRSYEANAPELRFHYDTDSLILRRCAAVVSIRMHDTDFAEVAAYAQRIDERIQREVCDGR